MALPLHAIPNWRTASQHDDPIVSTGPNLHRGDKLSDMSAFDTARILTGPTASGKSSLALQLAERLGGELVSMDSMTLYRGLDIGTDKPSAEDRQRIPHHLIDVFDPWESATVAWWLAAAEAACADIAARGLVPIIVGGTPFYLKALLHGLFPGPPASPKLRQQLENDAVRDGAEALHARLAAVDPKTAARLHPNDIRRVVRALEVHELTGRPISSWQQTWDTPAFATQPLTPLRTIPTVVLQRPRDALYKRINNRVVAMLDAGWLDEAARLRDLPQPLSREARQALGYRELFEYLDGRATSWADTVDRIQMRTRQFAKRQLTWFRHWSACVPVDADSNDVVERILSVWAEERNPGIS